MGKKRGKLGFGNGEAEMLEAEAAGQLFALRRLGWGTKRIAREMGIARNTARAWLQKGEGRIYEGPRRTRALEAHREWLRERWRAGVRNGDVLRQELAAMGTTVSLRTVERAVRPLRREDRVAEKATVRFETPPGKQMQVDFGEKWLEIGGVRVKRHVFVATLGFSRRTFALVLGSMRQRDWIVGLEAAFRHFGGVPEELLTDNASPLVTRQESGKAVFHPEFLAFCGHWGILPRACQPYRARTKGKVENGVGYVKHNALGSLAFEDDAHLDRHLVWWMREVADPRLHGTTHERPIDRYLLAEQGALRPVGAHPGYLRVRHVERRVASDARVDVDTNRYSVPAQFVGEAVDVVIESDLLQVHWQGRVIAEHAAHPGRHQVIEDPGHMESFAGGRRLFGKPCGIARDLAEYEKAAGGEAW